MSRVNRCGAVWIASVLLSVAAAPATAHDFWVQPSRYWIGQDSLTSMTLQVGHGPFRQRSPIPARRIQRFEAVAPHGGVIDLRARLRLGESESDGDFAFADPGTYVLVLQTDDGAQTHLPAIRFNDYLHAEGLTPALEQRAREHRMDDDGSERYRRVAKSLVQVGPSAAAAKSHASEPIGLPLEIVPETSPYDVPRRDALSVVVLYEGRALTGALVKLTDLRRDASPLEMHLTDHDGRASFAMPSSGTWLLNVIWTKALTRADDVDFETVFSSLSFGFPAEDF